jgi:altronate dehydratase
MTAAAGILRLHSDDDVAVAIRNLRAGEMIDDLVMQTDIPSGHKVAMRALATGDVIRKYGQPVGVATRDIARGAHVHTHNIVAVQSGRDEIRIRYRSPRADNAMRDCGPVLHGKKSLAACGDDVFDLILATASVKKSASEKSGFGDLEFVPWQLGITL